MIFDLYTEDSFVIVEWAKDSVPVLGPFDDVLKRQYKNDLGHKEY